MSMTEALLHKRLAETPEMEPCDGVKLLYQSRFGCGHLLPPNGQLAERIQAEADELPENDALPSFSFIGNGLCRMNLAAPAVRALPPERLARMMTLTVEDVPPMQPGDERLPGFEHDLSLLRAAALAGRTRFSAAALDGYLAEYRAAGYPPVSHSPRYRAAYRPAYRVISGDFAVLLPLRPLPPSAGRDLRRALRHRGRRSLLPGLFQPRHPARHACPDRLDEGDHSRWFNGSSTRRRLHPF